MVIAYIPFFILPIIVKPCRVRMNSHIQNLVQMLRLMMQCKYQECIKTFITHIMMLPGESRMVPCRTKNGMEEQGKEAELEFYGD